MPVNPAAASIVSYQAKRLTDGSSDLYCVVRATSLDKIDVFYQITYHDITSGLWIWLADIPWGGLWGGVMVKFGSRPAPTIGVPFPAAVRLVDQIRVQTISLIDDTDTALVTVTTPTNLATIRITPANFTYVCYGQLGDVYGFMNVQWDDLSKFVNGIHVTLTKFGVTSPTVSQTLFEWSGANYSIPNFVQVKFKLLPPGILLDNPPDWPPDPPVSDTDAALWVVEGDMLTLKIEIKTDDPHNYPATVITKNFRYYRQCRFYQIVDSATISQPYSVQLDVIQDPWGGLPMVGTFDLIGGFPPPGPDTGSGGWKLTPAGLLTCIPGPTVANPQPGYTLQVRCTSKGNGQSIEPVIVHVNIAGIPKIKAPGHAVNLVVGLPWNSAYDLYATNNPDHFTKVSGTMPAGLSIDLDGSGPTGIPGTISGTPTTPELAHDTAFTATNAAGTSTPAYIITWTVNDYDTPTVISAATLTAYKETNTFYKILTDAPAQIYRAFNLPDGLVLLPNAGIITGTVKDSVPLQAYQVGIKAANQWGQGEVFTLTIIVAIPVPEITSNLDATTLVNEDFDYGIEATHHPNLYTASGLPPTLTLNRTSGHITGIPAIPTPLAGIPIKIKAINAGGASDEETLTLHVITPPVPEIDTKLTSGHAITAETGKPFNVSIGASHNPTSWVVTPIPQGLQFTVDPNNGACILTGPFSSSGLYGVLFTAFNSGGPSASVTIWFLVTESPEEAEIVNQLGSIVEIWVNMATAAVTVGNELTPTIGPPPQNQPLPPVATSMTIKRGDTTEVQVIFHDSNIPTDINISSLKFGIKTSYDDEFIVFSDRWDAIPDQPGHFRIYPDFSGTNDDLDSILVNASTPLLAEIQWEITQDDGSILRRSSQVFTINILRDLIHPD